MFFSIQKSSQGVSISSIWHIDKLRLKPLYFPFDFLFPSFKVSVNSDWNWQTPMGSMMSYLDLFKSQWCVLKAHYNCVISQIRHSLTVWGSYSTELSTLTTDANDDDGLGLLLLKIIHLFHNWKLKPVNLMLHFTIITVQFNKNLKKRENYDSHWTTWHILSYGRYSNTVPETTPLLKASLVVLWLVAIFNDSVRWRRRW